MAGRLYIYNIMSGLMDDPMIEPIVRLYCQLNMYETLRQRMPCKLCGLFILTEKVADLEN